MVNGAPRGDITPMDLDELEWSSSTPPVDSIHQLAELARREALKAIRWYGDAKRTKKAGARVLRALTILSATSAGLLTVLAQWFDGVPEGELRVPAISISLALAVSGGLLGMDRYFGFSRAWIRYTSAELQVRTALNEFNMGWPERMAAWKNGVPDEAQAREAIAACTGLVGLVDSIIKVETDQWIADFQASLKDIDGAIKAATKTQERFEEAQKKGRQAGEPGALNVTVENGDQCDDGWTLVVGDRSTLGRGKTTGVTGLSPGPTQVSVEGAIGGAAKLARKVVVVAPGAVTDCSLSLA